MRPYRDEDDYWRIRSFLRDLLPLNDYREHSWHVYRWDYCRWHVWENIVHPRLDEAVFLWETPDGDLAAVLNVEDLGDAFFQVHPAWRSVAMEEWMLDVAEERLAVPGPDGRPRLRVWANQADQLRQATLCRRGYAAPQRLEHQRRQSLARVLDDVSVPAGYTVRALGAEDELPARSWASWRAFHPDAPNTQYEGWSWYRSVQRAPLYRRDLDIVAVAPGGAIAAFCTVWFDDVTRTGAFEPVGTAPEHQRRGLGRAIMAEGLRRLAWLGATLAYVASVPPAAHALYAAAGFTDYELHGPWTKELTAT
jgi:GNAT superfamily N-acetyltransferase